MPFRPRVPLLLQVLVCVWLLAPCSAAEPLSAQLTPLAFRPRLQAPELMDVTLTSRQSGLLEGVLELTFLRTREPLLVQRTHELVLQAGSQSLRLLVPPVTADWRIPPDEARLRFLTKGRAIDLGSTPLPNRSAAAHFTIAVVRARTVPRTDETPLWQRLQIQDVKLPTKLGFQLTSSPVFIEPEELPESPLHFCAFDIVLLEGDGFASLREKQLTALGHWVRAGGSLCIALGSEKVRPEALAFLNQLTGEDHGVRWSLDEYGAAQPDAPLKDGMLQMRTDLGCAVVMIRPPREDPADLEAHAQSAAAFLWKARRGPGLRVHAGSGRFSGSWPEHRVAVELINLLAPTSIRMVPVSLLAVVLIGFVLLIGPIDWFLLGWLRKRRWTWLLFPTVSIAITVATVSMANHYLGRTSHRTAIVIHDVGTRGQVLRRSRFELIFAAREQQIATEVRHGLFGPLNSGGYMEYNPHPRLPTPHFVGQFPANYVLQQQVQQWAPRLNRTTWIEPVPDTSGIRWEAFDPSLAVETLRERMCGDTSSEFYFFKGPEFLSGHQSDRLRNVALITSARDDGVFMSLTQLSPNGCGNMDDLALHPMADGGALVVVVQRVGEEIRMFRRLYRL